MKQIALNILLFFYISCALLVLGWTILFPFGKDMKDFPLWTGWIAYPLSVIIMVTQGIVLNYFEKKIDLFKN